MTDSFDTYFFTSNLTNHVCPGFGSFKCPPPNACARDSKTGKEYCCDTSDVCWTIPATCSSDGSTINCGSGSYTWCCLDNSEVCTGTSNQINICWNSAHDTLTNISASVLNDTYSSLSSATPKASSWSFSPLSLIAETSPLPSSSTATSPTSAPTTSSASGPTTSSSSSSTSPSSSASSGPVSSSSSHLSGGAIGGIVVGAIAAVALVALVLLLFLRRKRASAPHQDRYDSNAPVHAYYADEGHGIQQSHLGSPQVPMSELSGQMQPGELPAHSLNELPGDSKHLSANPTEMSSISSTTKTPGHAS
ncbi:hypothetical protein K461DRAFT_275632 [Myriangium duriaei CBS 260.36]|uniref:Mid2 domain-containing protein n=1 Tax=Myriangium duriaei CBS 260.36 TaxID=1168546 RepID=A0A9P4MLS9_9PEZI|nr:hypothetical protein K461DRAFT_275632 [Myriangium duriaei CBS 260.36]